MKQTLEMARTAYKALENKKGENVRILDISNISLIADYFVIANGQSDSQVKALAEHVAEKMSQAGYELKDQEGKQGSSWILMDYRDVIVHVFDKDGRAFYNLDHVWSDALNVDVDS